ncbi:hypothetical protein CRI93_01665 [Longimonas halophila]|uniref:Tll0287-like domain-containing protein n=1 Tax=Longimonas halophila TaxID=1469170 RepID=A0A2H3P1K8_9BACT|nr:DUF3365 domain-containing protein [Longimonas halophila]PEN09460.1 hypothetical protein CRI93_01665 [Longimonas halophila]
MRRQGAIRQIALLALLGGSLMLTACVQDTSDAEEAAYNASVVAAQARVETSVEGLDVLRSSLARQIDDPDAVDQSTFARVCQPVGRRAQALAQENGWVVQQLAERNRNPAHTLDDEARTVHERFAENPDLQRVWHEDTVLNGTSGQRFFQRITVEETCLACHGPKGDRPAFVKSGYPNDRAYGFETGDLRGLYAVFVPDSLLTAAQH